MERRWLGLGRRPLGFSTVPERDLGARLLVSRADWRLAACLGALALANLRFAIYGWQRTRQLASLTRTLCVSMLGPMALVRILIDGYSSCTTGPSWHRASRAILNVPVKN